jgi:hypothetical protein
MIRELRRHVRAEPERGAALPLALAFLIMFSILIGLILGLEGLSLLNSSKASTLRNDTVAVSGAVDAAIRYAVNDTNHVLGSASDPTCPSSAPANFFQVKRNDENNVPANLQAVTVTCQSDPTSGQSLGTTSAPGFAILTLAPYSNQSPTGCADRPPNEAGIVQPKAANLVTVIGDVYVNSGIDTSQYVGGCPQESNATDHINVQGNALVREGCADLVILQPTPPVTPAYKATCPISSNPPAALTDPAITNPAQWALPFATPPAVQPVPSCGASPLVTFTPGTYNDVTAFNTLMGGGCPNHLFWFQPGAYYFDYTNSGSHQWTINDPTARIVGGQPNAINVGATTVGPTTWKPATTSSANFATPNNALVIDGTTTNATVASGQTAKITLSGYVTNPSSTIPVDATISSVRLRVAHGEDTPALVQSPTVTITPPNAAACAAVPVTPRATVGEDAAPSYDVTSCLNTPSKINGGVSLSYSVTHCTGVANGCSGASTTARLDGIWLDVTYTTGSRQAWNPANPASITATSPKVPGACRHDADVNWTDGVQFVFGGDSRVDLQSGAFELCDKPSNTQQEIVLYGVKAAAPNTVGPNTWRPSVATQTTGTWTNPNNALTVDNNSASTSFTGSSSGGTTRRLTLSSYATNPVSTIPANATITVANLRVAHNESGPTPNRISSRSVTVTPVGLGACSALTVNGSTNATPVTQTFDVLGSGCLNTPAKINAGFSSQYSTTYTCSGTCSGTTLSNLDGIELDVTYTTPGSSGALDGESGCIVQANYYAPTDHSPAFNGACALFRIDSVTGQSPRTAVFWGTVYTPSAALDIPVDIMTVPVFNRGVVARMLMLGFNSANSSSIPISTTPLVGSSVNRTMTLSAVYTNKAGQTTSVTANVLLCDFGCSGVQVLSWKTNR